MYRIKKVLLTAGVVSVLIAAGCHKFTGGGWFYGYGGEKVNFGFIANCVESVESEDPFDRYYEGQFQYADRQNGVRFHGDINWAIGILGAGDNTCETQAPSFGDPFEGNIFGVCRSQPGNVEGNFEVYVFDDGTVGPSAGDFISVIADCTADGSLYSNAGYLGGGNIKSHGH